MEYVQKPFELHVAQKMMSLGYVIATKSGITPDCISINDQKHRGFPIKCILESNGVEYVEYFNYAGKSKSGKEELVFVKPNDQVDKSTLKLMQYVLVRNTPDEPWTIDVYTGSYTNANRLNPRIDGDKIKQYACIGGVYEYCIPYKGNEKLFKTC